MTSLPSALTQPENSLVTLTCKADGGHPDPDVTIYRDGVVKVSGKSTATLAIKLTKSDNQVAFVCKAKSAGITGQMTSNEIKYNVQCEYIYMCCKEIKSLNKTGCLSILLLVMPALI